MPLHILIADDDRELAEAVGWYLEAEGLRVTVVADGREALEAFDKHVPDAAVLDLMMPGRDGFEVITQIRGQSDLPILVLSAKDTEPDKVRALGLGADDYVTKPFGAMELVARIKALLRRAGLTDKAPLTSPHLQVLPDQRQVLVHDQPVALSTLEFDLLACLMRHARTVLSRSQLGDAIWGDDFYGDLRLVDSHVYHLRQKLREAGLKPLPVVTVRGVGYVFRPEG
jgi:DNA-binding response OmpR family regulator